MSFLDQFSFLDQYNDLYFKSVVYHETVPGHHLQTEYSLKNSKLHSASKLGGTSGYSEGWAVYSEKLAYEMDFFKNPKAKLTLLLKELRNAALIVLDVGVNYFDWEKEDIDNLN